MAPKQRAPEKWARHKEALMTMRAQLLGETGTGVGDAEFHGDDADLASAIELTELEGLTQERRATLLHAVDGALKRLENNAYGQCTKCNRTIAKARLEALPQTELCIHCARRIGNAQSGTATDVQKVLREYEDGE